MGQNMGQEVLCNKFKVLFELQYAESGRKSPEIVRFQDFLWRERTK